MHFVHVKMGVSPGWGGGSRLTKLVGRQKALQLIAASKPMDAALSKEFNFADDVAPAGGAMDLAMQWAAAYSRGAHGECQDTFIIIISISGSIGHADRISCCVDAVRAVKRVVAAADDLPLTEALKYERSAFQSVWGGPSNLAALNRSKKKAAK